MKHQTKLFLDVINSNAEYIKNSIIKEAELYAFTVLEHCELTNEEARKEAVIYYHALLAKKMADYVRMKLQFNSTAGHLS